MSEKTDAQMIEAVWAEARDLVKRLEGSTVQRFAVKAGDYEIEIERGMPVAGVGGADNGAAAAPGLPTAPVAGTAGPGPGVSPGARSVSGVFSLEDMDTRIPVLAPLVGTFYRSAQPGSKPFAEVGDVIEPGATVCIVEAMKLMNEVVASEKGKVAEIPIENGDWVEFEQVLMYLEPVD
jgi:acetyl-CoA carboxylase biotin carboxyl carrier protein